MMSSKTVTNHNAKDIFGCPFCVGWGTNARIHLCQRYGSALVLPFFKIRYFFGRSKPLPYGKVEARESRSEAELP